MHCLHVIPISLFLHSICTFIPCRIYLPIKPLSPSSLESLTFVPCRIYLHTMSDLIQMQFRNVSFFICIWQQASPGNHYLANPFILYSYEITLLSNGAFLFSFFVSVLYPYEITLLSNLPDTLPVGLPVLYPYEITLLSNSKACILSRSFVLHPYEITYSQTSI